MISRQIQLTQLHESRESEPVDHLEPIVRQIEHRQRRESDERRVGQRYQLVVRRDHRLQSLRSGEPVERVQVPATEYQLTQLVPVAEQNGRQDRQIDPTSGDDQRLDLTRQMELGGGQTDVETVGCSQRQCGNKRVGEVTVAVGRTVGRHPVVSRRDHSLSQKTGCQHQHSDPPR